MVERRGFEPLTSAVRGRGWGFEFEAGRKCLFDLFPRDGGHREASVDSEKQPCPCEAAAPPAALCKSAGRTRHLAKAGTERLFVTPGMLWG